MTANDLQEFTLLLDSVCTMLSRGKYTPNETSTMMFFRSMAPYTLPQFRQLLQAHVDASPYVPSPHDIHERFAALAVGDGRPGPEEAWAQVRRAGDESVTLVWTVEMSEAFGVASTLLDEGDDVGARMAFKEVYTKLVEAARAVQRPASWSVTLGTNKALRNDALLPHVQAGRIGAELLIEHAPVKGLDDLLALPAPADADVKTLGARDKALADLREVRESIKAQPSARELRRRAMAEAAMADRDRTADLKADAARLAAEAELKQIGERMAARGVVLPPQDDSKTKEITG